MQKWRTPVVFWKASLVGGLIAASVDVLAAALIGRHGPMLILHAIASGVLGRAAFFGGARSALLGLLLQWLMGLLIALVYALVAARAPAIGRRWLASGVIYGVLIYLVMNLVVVPLSAAPFKPQFTPDKIIENLLAMILFGLIVSFCVSIAVRSTNAAQP
ncbi:MAG: hypothetical protein ACRETQ_13235 [Gammaproteobacteria bacterium]